jgi:hypothetical protein
LYLFSPSKQKPSPRTLHSPSGRLNRACPICSSCSRARDISAFPLPASALPPSNSHPTRSLTPPLTGSDPMDFTKLPPATGLASPPQQPSPAAGFGLGSPTARSFLHMVAGAGKPKRKRLGNTGGPWSLTLHRLPSRNNLRLSPRCPSVCPRRASMPLRLSLSPLSLRWSPLSLSPSPPSLHPSLLSLCTSPLRPLWMVQERARRWFYKVGPPSSPRYRSCHWILAIIKLNPM